MWWTYALLSAFFAALTAIFAKVGIRGLDPTLATAVRTVVVVILAWAIVFFRGGAGGLTSISGTTLLFLSMSGIATGLSWIFYFQALAVGPVSQVAAIDKLSVAIVLVLSMVFLKEPFALKSILGIGLITAGALVLIN